MPRDTNQSPHSPHTITLYPIINNSNTNIIIINNNAAAITAVT